MWQATTNLGFNALLSFDSSFTIALFYFENLGRKNEKHVKEDGGWVGQFK